MTLLSVEGYFTAYEQHRSGVITDVSDFVAKPVVNYPCVAARIALHAAQRANSSVSFGPGFGLALPETGSNASHSLAPAQKQLAAEIIQAWVVNSWLVSGALTDPIAEQISTPTASLNHLRCSFLSTWMKTGLSPEDIGLDPVPGETREVVFTNMRDGGILDTTYAKQQIIDTFRETVSNWE